jgi:hypothetical protein
MPVVVDVGDTAILIGMFTNDENQPADPTDLTVTVRKPDDTVVALEAEPVEVGTWEAACPVDQEGIWWYRFEDPGDNNTPSFAEEEPFFARVRRVPEQLESS